VSRALSFSRASRLPVSKGTSIWASTPRLRISITLCQSCVKRPQEITKLYAPKLVLHVLHLAIQRHLMYAPVLLVGIPSTKKTTRLAVYVHDGPEHMDVVCL
jgi:hypothetical protein